ncbi:flagellar basal body P-ring formation chaperone FlgA [Halomonas sp. BN3-1]|uniref:flagellar basal body P-ring formation chaperone FlgA n=1 Tax=Halomonas sp. BN3-1 TaxID=2082393 RepID=UPI000D352D44|nr:flagellar basal body P-ring formation chaperone FlgA [Halomonas sp. BN3-1]
MSRSSSVVQATASLSWVIARAALVLCVSTGFAASTGYAAAQASGQAVDDGGVDAGTGEALTRVESFLFEQALADGARPGDLDIQVFPPAASLADCRQPEPFLPRAGSRLAGRVSVGLRCEGERHRSRYLQAEITRLGERLVAARDIAPGERLSADMLTSERFDVSRLPSQALTDPQAAIGQIARRGIRQGQALSAHQLTSPKLVRRGEQVAVEASGRGFRISRQGEALEAGGLGDIVRVRVDRRQILDARVVEHGRLAVTY